MNPLQKIIHLVLSWLGTYFIPRPNTTFIMVAPTISSHITSLILFRSMVVLVVKLPTIIRMFSNWYTTNETINVHRCFDFHRTVFNFRGDTICKYPFYFPCKFNIYYHVIFTQVTVPARRQYVVYDIYRGFFLLSV